MRDHHHLPLRRLRATLALLGLAAAAVAGAGVARTGSTVANSTSDEIASARDRFLSREPEGAPAAAARGSDAGTGTPEMSLGAGSTGSCVRQSCATLGIDCRDDSTVLGIARACSGNVSGDCARVACEALGRFACSTTASLLPVVAACRSDWGGGCLARACRLAGTYACNERRSVIRLIEACSGNFGDRCVTAVCAELGAFGCDTVDKVSRVLEACGTGR